MKQLFSILIIALCLTMATPAQAQRGNRKLGKEQAEQLFNAKVKMMQEKLALSDEQTEKLIPVYQNYLNELETVFNSRKHPRRYKPTSADDACKVITERLDINARVIDLQKKYIREYAKFLNADQVMKIYRVENQIQREIWKEKRRRQGK